MVQIQIEVFIPNSIKKFTGQNTGKPAKCGSIWTLEDQITLGKMVDGLCSIDTIASVLQRTDHGIVYKMMQICRRNVIKEYAVKSPKCKGRKVLENSLYFSRNH